MKGYNLADFGSYYVGGQIHEVTDGEIQTVNFTRDVRYDHDPKGHFAIGHSYVQYFVPQERNELPPVVLVHGGGMCGSVWENTPDRRKGWLQLLLQRGFECHVIDMVERGRSGFAPNHFEGNPFVRSMEEAWHLFRFGDLEGFESRQAFEHQLFPIDHFETFVQSLVPRWVTTSHLQVAALQELLGKLEHSIVICHSQGGEVALDASCSRPQNVAGLIAIEPSGAPTDLSPIAAVPLLIIKGDYTQKSELWQQRVETWQRIVETLGAQDTNVNQIDLPEAMGPGNSHFPMLDLNNSEVLDLSLETLLNT